MQNSQKTEFSFLQWNTLNSEYSNIEAFPKADPKILTWDYRKPLIEEELKKIQADIICLEEVNAGDVEFFKSVFQDKYETTYQKKGKSSEGLCFLYSKEKFEGIVQPKLESYIDADGKPQSYVYQIHILKLKNKENHFLIVGLTHLKSKSAFASARLQQVDQFTKFLKVTTEEFKSQNPGAKVATLVGGDFNDEPHSEVLQRMKNETNLKSVFEGVEFTTFKHREKEYCRVIDYILYDDQALSLEKRGEIPQKKDLGEFGLPNEKHPSDHLPIYCTFAFSN